LGELVLVVLVVHLRWLVEEIWRRKKSSRMRAA
jgi:hypothetical protein